MTSRSSLGPDRTLPTHNIQEGLKNFDRKKESQRRDDANAEALNISSAIGTETPMTVLIDIRQCICELTNVIRKSNEDAALREEDASRRHNEVLAYISDIGDTLRKHRPESQGHTVGASRAQTPSKQEQREYYYGGDKLSTKNAVVAAY